MKGPKNKGPKNKGPKNKGPKNKGPNRLPPPLGHEILDTAVPGFGALCDSVAGELRGSAADDEVLGLGVDEVAEFEDVLRFARRHVAAEIERGAHTETALYDADLLVTYLHFAVNFELHRRKTFWIEPDLVALLEQTDLDITGDQLRPPFSACAFVFTDEVAKRIAREMMVADGVSRIARMRTVTVYLVHREMDDEAELAVRCVVDQGDGRWPWVLGRDLHILPTARLDEMIDSHFADVDIRALDPVFGSAATRDMLRLVLNSVLYATSAGIEVEQRAAPVRASSRRPGKLQPGRWTSVDVFYLPGHIDITQGGPHSDPKKSGGEGTLTSRFMVRGHWRRANPNWEDQRQRWIAPYWKGPDMAAAVERTYRLKR